MGKMISFVFFPHGESGAQNAPLIIEAKRGNFLSIQSERFKAYKQARSYAKMMESGIFGLCDEERLVLFKRDKHGLFNYTDCCFENRWGTIMSDVSTHMAIRRLIGIETIKSIL